MTGRVFKYSDMGGVFVATCVFMIIYNIFKNFHVTR